MRSERDVVNGVRVGVLHLRPGANGARAVLAVRGEDRIEVLIKGNRDALPVAFVCLPQSVAAGAPVVERVEQPVAHEVAGGAGYPGRHRRASGDLKDAAVDRWVLPVAQHRSGAFVAAGPGFQ